MRLLLLILAWAILAVPSHAQPAPTLPLGDRIVQAALEHAQAQGSAGGGQCSFQVAQAPHIPAMRLKGGDLRMEATAISKREPIGRFFVTLRILEDGRPVGYTRVDLDGKWTGTLLKANESLARRAVPAEGQLESVPFEGIPPAGALTAFPGGYRLRQPVAAGHVLTHADLEAIPLVNAGERVRLIAASDELSISTEAIARSTGAAGDRVRLEMPGSKKALVAVVTAAGEARLDWNRARP